MSKEQILALQNKFNRLGRDQSQTQEFGDEIIELIAAHQGTLETPLTYVEALAILNA